MQTKTAGEGDAAGKGLLTALPHRLPGTICLQLCCFFLTIMQLFMRLRHNPRDFLSEGQLKRMAVGIAQESGIPHWGAGVVWFKQ